MRELADGQYVVHSKDAKRIYRENTSVSGPLVDVTSDVVPDNAICVEYDTGRRFVWDGQLNQWMPINDSVTQQESTNKLLSTISQQLSLLIELTKELL